MALLQSADSMPTYIIYRDAQPGEPFDPTANLLFFPPKGSDELFDALRIAFPAHKSHSERMREAVIQYLLEEQQSLHTSPAMTMDSTWPPSSTGCPPSALASPESNNLSTPASFAASPQIHAPELTRQASTATTASQSSPPALDQMTSVFSLSTSQQPKQRVRRKMTEAEKVEYRKRRIVKACEKCAKRKRKCPHNQTEMETLASTTTKSNARVSKSTSPKSSKSPPSTQQQQALLDPTIFSAEDVDFVHSFDSENFMPTEDFALFQDEDPFIALNLMSYDHFDPTNSCQAADLFTPDLSPTQQDYQQSDLQNIALFDQSLASEARFDLTVWESQSSSSAELYSSSGSLGRHLLPNSHQTTHVDMLASLNSLASAPGHQQLYGQLEDAQSFNRGNSQSKLGSASQMSDKGGNSTGRNIQQASTDTGKLGGYSQQKSNGQLTAFEKFKKRKVDAPGGSGEDLLREQLRTGQPEKPVPTHTAHVHEAQSRQLSALDEAVITPQGTSKQRPHQQKLQQSARVSSSRAQDLTSTSVSVSGELTSAPPQGRPFSSSNENAAARQTAQQQTQQRSRCSHQAAQSLGQGLPQDADPSSQLYMARKRVMGGLVTHSRLQTRTYSAASRFLQQQQISSTKGGAYPRLGDTDSSPPMLLTAKPSQSPGATNVGRDATQRQDHFSDHVRIQDLRGRQDARQDVKQDVHEVRLLDTKMYKDHHGRAPLSSYLFIMVGCTLLLATSLLSTSISSTALLLAFVMPCQEASQTTPLETIVHCTTKNSRWLSSAFASLVETKYGLAIPSREKQGWYFPGTEGTWLKRSMDPSALACC